MMRAVILGLVGMGMGAMFIAPTAKADCRTTSVCVYQNGRQVCRSEQQCTSRRVPICTNVNRCTPVRTCSTAYGRTVCSYRDVCRTERVCS